MKKITFLAFALFVSIATYAQLTIDDTDMTPFEDISSTGIALGLTDDGEENIVIPFEFNLDGQVSSDIRVGNNGGVLFGATEGDLFAGNLPLDGESPRIVPFWDDLDDETGDVYWEVLGTEPARRVIIQWDDRPHFPGQTEIDPATFQLVLFETTNDILFVYDDVLFDDPDFDNGQSATIGVVSETNVYQYAFNDPSPLEGINAIRFSIPNESFTACGPTGQVIDPDASNEGDIVTSVITIAENGIIGDEFSIENVMIDITHDFVGDLDINLTSPMGTTLVLSNENGGSGNNYTDTVFQDGGDPINASSAPFTGTFEPQGGSFADTFTGEELNGDWTLTIIDVFSSSEMGTLNNFCITFVSFAIICPEDIIVVNNPTIAPVAVTTTFTPGFGTLPEALIDGSGLSDFPDVNATHEDTTTGNSFVSNNEITGSFDFDLGGTFMLNGVSIWNQNAGGPGGEGEEGLNEIILSASLDGVDYTVIPNAPTTVAQVTDDGLLDPEQFGFTDTEASFIRLEVLSNHGDDDTGFAEIAFVGIACDAIVTYDLPIATGTDEIPSLIGGLESGSTFPLGITTNEFIVANNDSSSVLSCVFDVIIMDETQPFFIGCPDDFEVNQAGDSTVALDDFTAIVSASDNCSDVTIVQDPIGGTILDQNTVQTVTLTATDASGNAAICTFDITILSSLGIDDETLGNVISIYPNPTRDIITLTNTGNEIITQIHISDMNGRIIQTITNDNLSPIQMNIEDYASGIYFIRLQTATASTVKRIIKN